ncbi:hypothetical protein [Bifidobacterium subtile]|jgi:hypothetical protein|uniref:hypothetical protein n=1 Tax=Bifidobacterium subtile TaxID=77635 RepID=UPI002F357852
MTGVLAENEGRGDYRLLRNVTNRLGVLWERLSDPAAGYVPVDLTDWYCKFELLSNEGDVWFSRDCDAHGPDGKAVVYIPPLAFSDAVWAGRRSGEWRITASKSGVTELLGWGYWYLA